MTLNKDVNFVEKVITVAEKLFWQFGIRSVSMDNVARECGISKKTIYQYFTDKAALVNAVVQKLAIHHQAQLEEARQISKNVIEEVFNEFRIYVSAFYNIHAVFFYELEKLFPDSWSELNELSNKYNYPFVVNNLERGISEGFYRPGLDISTTADIRITQLKLMLARNIFYQETKSLLNNPEQINLFYLHAITTSKGKRNIDRILDRNNESREAYC